MCKEIYEEDGNFRILIRKQNGKWIDVTKKKAIIYGAGQGCLDLMNEFLLPNIGGIVDGDKNKWDKELQLLSKTYRVQTPSILLSLDLEKYYIVISSGKYESSIRTSIKKYVGKDNITICNKENIYYCYKKIEDMLYYDPLMKKKILKLNLSFIVDRILSFFKKINKSIGNIVIDRFIPVKDGDSKLIIFFGNEDELWVFSISGLHNEFEKMAIDRDKKENKKIRCEFKKKFSIDSEITLFENEDITIQKYAGEYVDFSSDEIKRCILSNCRMLHRIKEKIDIENDMISRYYSDLIEKVIKGGTPSIKEVRRIEQSMKRPLEMLKMIKYVPKVCHCDLFCSNIVGYKNELFFIDWEYMAMCDPMFDVCGYLFSIGGILRNNSEISYEEAVRQVYASLSYDLSLYYKRKCTEEEYIHAFLVMILFECRNVLGECLYGKKIDVEKVNILLERIKLVV